MSSGASTPRASQSPGPGSEAGGPSGAPGGPSPLTIGKRFVKQYYQVLSSTPEQIYRFYQPTSVLSDGEGSSPADPVTFESTYQGEAEKLKDRFFVKDLQIRFEFEHGAIDAQQSVNGALLLVVTGHIVYFPSASEDEDAAVDDPIRKGFVHTFFLNALTSGTKKSFYVHNDILRFLNNPAEVSSISEAAEIENEPLAVVPEPAATEPASETKKADPSPEKKQTRQTPAEPKPVEPLPISKTEAVEEAPGGGVEETKEDVAPIENPAPPKAAKEEKAAKKDGKGAKKEVSGSKDGSKGGKGNTKSKEQEVKGEAKNPGAPPSPAPKPTPGSWASLVAGAGGAVTAPSSAVKAPTAQAVNAAPVPVPAASSEKASVTSNDKKENSSAAANNNSNGNQKMGNNSIMRGDRPPKRDPDCTLVIKNLPDGTKESEVIELFEPFAGQTNSTIVGITVSAHRGIAFVDYDSINPVMKAVELHQKEPMRLKGRLLEVDQKTAEQRARRAAQQRGGGGGNFRSGSPNNRGGGRGGGNRRGGGRDAGRGDRGGRGGRGGRY